MSIEELEAEALRMNPTARARLAERLLESLETLSQEENAKIWAEEAERRDQGWNADAGQERSSSEVFSEARTRLEWTPGISFHELAERELNDAAQYYERESPGLGTAFIAEVERTTLAISQHPHAGSSLPSGIQRRLLRRFPYALLYRVTSDRIRILAVMNLRRRPAYWAGRS
jgi:toxin ParE1/3/4